MPSLKQTTLDQQSPTVRNWDMDIPMQQTRLSDQRPTTRVLSITSGKGGVGKTAVVANVAVLLARMNKRVLVLDADLGLANIDVVFGLAPGKNMNAFFAEEMSLDEIMIKGPSGIRILPAGSGVQRFTRLNARQKMRLLEALDSMHNEFDIVLIDNEAGISENVTYFNTAAQEILVVTTPEPTAITDAYALMKLLSGQYHEKHFNLIVNCVRSSEEGLDVFKKLTMVADRYLDIAIDYLGCIPIDRQMVDAIRKQEVIVDLFPNSKISQAFDFLARVIVDEPQHLEAKGSVQFFWERLLDIGGK